MISSVKFAHAVGFVKEDRVIPFLDDFVTRFAGELSEKDIDLTSVRSRY